MEAIHNYRDPLGGSLPGTNCQVSGDCGNGGRIWIDLGLAMDGTPTASASLIPMVCITLNQYLPVLFYHLLKVRECVGL